MKPGCTSDQPKQQKSIALPVVNGLAEQQEIRKSRTSRWRAAVLVGVNLLMIAHFIQWWFMGQTLSPIEPSETMYTLQRGAINVGFIFFSLAILATIIFGRFVCGWGCHILALQDFCAWILKKLGLTPKPFRSRLLIYIPLLAALYMFAWPTVIRALTKPEQEPLFPEFTNHIVTSNFWETFPTVAVAIPFLFICGFLTVYFLGSKGFCTYACPYGGFFRLADKFSPGKIRVTDACNQCGHCTATCTSNVLIHVEVKQFGMVVDPGCMKCMDCVSVCPNDALYFGFGTPAIAARPASKKTSSLTWPEEIAGAVVFFASLLAVWDVYQRVPFLMALGCAAISTFLVLKSWRLLRSTQVSFYRYQLKAGVMRTAGWIFLAVAVCWIGLNAHSGWVRYHEFLGGRAFQRLQIPDELPLAQANPSTWINPADRETINDGQSHLAAASKFGFFVNNEAMPKLAWFEFLSGSAEQAAETLAKVSSHQKGQAKALSLYYRGAILNRLGRNQEAQASLDQALAEREDLILAREEKGEALWQLGRRADAMSVWSDAVKRNSQLILARNALVGGAAVLGKATEAAALEKQTDEITPPNPLYHWMLGLRLQNLGMTGVAEKHFQKAIELDASLASRPRK